MGSLTLLGVGGPPAATAVTWNPADKAAGITLSNGNLTYTHAAGNNTNALVRATTSKSSGKWYYEDTFGSVADTDSWFCGFASGVLGTNFQLGSTASSVGYMRGIGGLVFFSGGVALSGLGEAAADEEVAMAIDVTTNKVWFKVLPGGQWNGNNAAHDPGTALGGQAISAGGITTWFPAASTYSADGDFGTGNFGASAFAGVIPVGFTSWDGLQSG